MTITKKIFAIFITAAMLLTLILILIPTVAFSADPSIEEQFNLEPGGIYYFDLSAQGIPGGINPSLPDTSLKWVPFTYTGMVNAYSRTSAGASTDLNVSVNKRSLFVADYNVTKAVSWDEINNAGLIFGKAGANYLLRSLSAGSNITGTEESLRGLPLTNEWDQILNKDTDYIKNSAEMYSWGQDTNLSAAGERYLRGYQSSPRGVWTVSTVAKLDTCGFRPVLEIPDPDVIGADGLKTITFNMGSQGTIGDKKTLTSAKVVYCDSLTIPAITEANGFNFTGTGTGTLGWYAGSQFYEPGTTAALTKGTVLTPGYGKAPTIIGPTEMSLTEGYSATATGGYTITGTAPVTVSKTSGDAKITWNDTTKKLSIATGLMAGSYPVVLTAQNGTSPNATQNFTLTVNATPVTVTSVTVMTAPTKTTYTDGELLDLSGLVVTLHKSNSTTEDVAFADFATKGITTTPTNGTGLSTTDSAVTITYTTDNQSVSQNITVKAAPTITTNALANGVVGTAYSKSLTATGDSPITWRIDSGDLPNGLTLEENTGCISGMPTVAGSFNFTTKPPTVANTETDENAALSAGTGNQAIFERSVFLGVKSMDIRV